MERRNSDNFAFSWRNISLFFLVLNLNFPSAFFLTAQDCNGYVIFSINKQYSRQLQGKYKVTRVRWGWLLLLKTSPSRLSDTIKDGVFNKVVSYHITTV
jgi:hypothetical protein